MHNGILTFYVTLYLLTTQRPSSTNRHIPSSLVCPYTLGRFVRRSCQVSLIPSHHRFVVVIGTLANKFCLDVVNFSINSSLDVRTNMVITQNVYKQARCRTKLWVAKYILLSGEKSLRKQENAYLGKTFIHRQFFCAVSPIKGE